MAEARSNDDSAAQLGFRLDSVLATHNRGDRPRAALEGTGIDLQPLDDPTMRYVDRWARRAEAYPPTMERR